MQETAALIGDSPLPTEIAAALASTPTRQGIFPVSGVVSVPDRVLKVDELVFQPGSRLELANTEGEWVAIVARRIRFINPTQLVTITRAGLSIAGDQGATGEAGSAGRNGNHRGGNGFQGGPGRGGGPGSDAPKSPHVYIYAGAVAVTGVTGPLTLANLRLEFPGVAGGPGGVGGKGGRGGNGKAGRNSRSNTFHCTRGAGDGGNGARGGAGGQGGVGGTGGEGSPVTIVATQENADILTSAMIVTSGGAGGQPGPGGAGGAGGGGASGGSGSRHCGGGDRGRAGGVGPAGAAGSAGQPGQAGKIEVVPITTPPPFLAN